MTRRYVVQQIDEYGDGRFVKLGGHLTRDMQEAQVVGWKSTSWDRYPETYKKIPVKIVEDIR